MAALQAHAVEVRELARDGMAAMARSARASMIGASFLVWANVPQWRAAVPAGASIGSHAELEKLIETKAREAGLNVEQPFPFVLKGNFDNVKYHVVRPPQAGSGHGGAASPSDFALNAEAIRKSATIVGFFSRSHEGVFTHGGNHAHLHVVLENGDWTLLRMKIDSCSAYSPPS